MTAQDSIVVTKNFKFENGVYLSFEEFQSNTPSHLLEELDVDYFNNPQTFVMQVNHIFNKASGEVIDAEKIWGISLDGIPFIRIPKGEVRRSLPSFAALKLRGKICYYTYPDWRVKKVPVAAYNPLTGRPFLKGEVERDEQVIVEKMLHFETGEIVEFNYDNLLQWIGKDKHLVETLERLSPEEVDEKLFRALLIFVDRHETHIIIEN